MSDYNLALTAAGQALMAKIAMGNGTIPLTITRIVTSSESSLNPLNDTAVVAPEQEFIITGRSTTGARTEIRTYLNNFGNPSATPPVPPLAVGYPMAQIGFYATDPDVGEIMMRVSQFDSPNYVPAASERSWEYVPSFNFVTGNASTVIINIDPSSSTTKQDIWNAVNISTDIPANLGVKTQYYIENDVPGYVAVEPPLIYLLQGNFDPTTGLPDGGNPLPTPDGTDTGSYWVATAAGSFTPPGSSTPLAFAVGDWLISNGVSYIQSAPINTMPSTGLFAGAKMVEIRVISDPSNPTSSVFQVVLPITVLGAVLDPTTGLSLRNILALNDDALLRHIGNVDVHVTDAWKTNIGQAIGALVAHTEDADIHVTAALKALWNLAAQNAADALALAQSNVGLINGLDGRVSQIEDSLFNGITSNPFTISFSSLSGLLVTYGIWNNILQRVEC